MDTKLGLSTLGNYTHPMVFVLTSASPINRYQNCSHCNITTREHTPYNGSDLPTLYRNSSSLSILTYSPKLGFYGADKLEVVAEDNQEAYSSVITVSISVRYRPCLNGGVCKVRKLLLLI